MAKYQFKLTPVSDYFFGGEKWIRDRSGKSTADYFVVSQDYPQQTTLLGLLRFYLLLINPDVFDGTNITDSNKATELIGEQSFGYRQVDSTVQSSIGVIHAISPLYFEKEGLPGFFGPLDYAFEMNDNGRLTFAGDAYQDKDHSEQIQPLLITSERPFNLSEIKDSISQVGNEKVSDESDKEGKYFRQTSQRLKEGWSFAFDAELDADLSDQPSLFIPFGGEKSFFKVEVQATSEGIWHGDQALSNYHRNVPYLFCASDCFVEVSEIKGLTFGVMDYVSYRNIQAKVKSTTRYGNLARKQKGENEEPDDDQAQLSSRYNLLKRGSVLYFQNKEACLKAAEVFTHATCEAIGFNKIFVQP